MAYHKIVSILIALQFYSVCLCADGLLSKGDFYKIAITERGVYKIDIPFLQSLGINAGIDVNTIQIFGKKPGMLPQNNAQNQMPPLHELPVKLYYENQRFQYLLFFAEGPHIWSYDSTSQHPKHQYNIYCDTAYYYLTHSQNVSKKISVAIRDANTGPTTTIYSSDAHEYHEKDLYNLLKSGREWYGEQFNTQLNYNISIPIIQPLPNSEITLNVAVASKPTIDATTQFNVKLNNVLIAVLPIKGFNYCENCRKGIEVIKKSTFTLANSPSNFLTFNIEYNKTNDPAAVGYLNYIEIFYKKQLIFNTSQADYQYYNPDKKDKIAFAFSNISASAETWNVSDFFNVTQESISNNHVVVQCDRKPASIVMMNANEVNKKPIFVHKIPNQNLHAMQEISFVIICPPEYVDAASKLKAHREKNGIKTAVVPTTLIYNEFSAGAQDITAIRNFCKMLYDKGSLKNILLLGACSYDYKNRIKGNTNQVPVYESRESLHDVNSYSSDDYYTFFEDHEGEWQENYFTNHTMDVGLGRLPVRTPKEAEAMIDKIIHYSTNKNTFGKWRNRACFLADNGDNNVHLNDADYLATKIDTSQKYLLVNKIYVDAFKFESTPQGTGIPSANIFIKKLIDNGLLFLNYSGHGGNEILASEKLVTQEIIETWKNNDRPPFFVTATCHYGEYDNPEKVSGGVKLVTKSNGGAIGLLSATRPVYSNTNFELNNAFYNHVFTRDAQGMPKTLGEIIKHTKNQSTRGINNRSYTLLGDPSLTLNMPLHQIHTQYINGNKIKFATQVNDTLKALSIVSIAGYISNHKDEILSDFNGVIYADIFDKYVKYTTFGQGNPQTSFKMQNNFLYSGKASVKNGKFGFEFTVPKDIDYSYGEGKISYYAYDPTTQTDATGYLSKMIVGGSNPNALPDDTPPTIHLYLNDSTFVNGCTVNAEPMLIAKLQDESGINISSYGIGHELKAVLDGNEAQPIFLSEYYTTFQDSYKSGIVQYNMEQLGKGKHTLKLTAWDTHNNSSQAEIVFYVASDNALEVSNAYVVPNPMEYHGEILLRHNRAGDDLVLHIQVIDGMGRICASYEEHFADASNLISSKWQPNSESGASLTAGYYTARCILTSKTDNSQTIKNIKLLLIR